MAEFKNLKGVNTLRASRHLLKRKILRVFNYLQTGENLTKSQVEKERVIAWSKEIESLNSKIYDACVKANIDLTRSSYLEDEEAESSYKLEVNRKLDGGKYSLTQTNLPHSSSSKNAGKERDPFIHNIHTYISHRDNNVRNSVGEYLTSLNFKISWHSSTTVSLQ